MTLPTGQRRQRILLMALFLALTAVGGLVASAPARAASHAIKLSPAKAKQLKKTRKSFEACRKDALGQLKKGSISKKKFEVSLNTCKESFPGASLYITCKKSAIKAAQSKNLPADEAIEQCKRYLVAASFDPEEPLPYFVENAQVYFAGIGMNRVLPVANLNPPNFDCEKLTSVARAPAQAQYFLFGNHPRAFAGLVDKRGGELMEALGMENLQKVKSEKGIDVENFGRIFGDPRGSSGVVFFPAANCDFDADLGDIYAGLSSYYLLDAQNSAITPYFGIAYYKQDQSAVSTAKLVQALIKELGPSFKSFKKNAHTTFVAAASISETDEEQDPKNLCKPPRAHRFVAVVQGRKDQPGAPEYVLLANIKNLCDFGDKMSKRLGG